MPDGEEMLQPTHLASSWIHQMTCLRELEWVDGQLYQRPLRELARPARQKSAAGRATLCHWPAGNRLDTAR